MEENKPKVEVLNRQTNWRELWLYKKTVVLYQLTYVFTRRFLPAYGDRTVDQMVQAARSGKQNIGRYSRWGYFNRAGTEIIKCGTSKYTRVA